jgi:hypothetical protein
LGVAGGGGGNFDRTLYEKYFARARWEEEEDCSHAKAVADCAKRREIRMPPRPAPALPQLRHDGAAAQPCWPARLRFEPKWKLLRLRELQGGREFLLLAFAARRALQKGTRKKPRKGRRAP